MSIVRIEEAIKKAKATRREDSPPQRLAAPAQAVAIGEDYVPEPLRLPAVPAAPVKRVVNVPSIRFCYEDGATVDVPISALQQNRVSTALDTSTWAVRFQLLADGIKQRLNGKHDQVLALTSANSHEGRTLCALNLAVCLAASLREQVVLVDADLRSPSVHRYLQLEPAKGLIDVLAGAAAVDDVTIRAAETNLVIVPAGERTLEYASLLTSARMQETMESLAKKFPAAMIVMDLPPLSARFDPAIFQQYIDRVLLIVEEGVTPQDAVRRALGSIPETAMLGTLLNKAIGTGR